MTEYSFDFTVFMTRDQAEALLDLIQRFTEDVGGEMAGGFHEETSDEQESA